MFKTFSVTGVRSILLPAALVSPSLLIAASGQPLDVQNPGFESGLSRWSASADFLKEIKAISITDKQARTGKKSLKLDTTVEREKGGPGTMVFQSIRNVRPNSIYYLTAWAKGGEGGQGSIRAAIKLEYYNADGKNTAGVNGYQSLMANGEWTRIQTVARTDDDTTSVKIYARNLESKAVIYFDDFEIAQPAILILEPTRLTHVPGKEGPVTLKVWTGDPLPAGAKLEVIATHEGEEKRYPAEVKEAGEHTYEVTATLPAIEKGHYELGVVWGEERSPVTARTFETLERRKPEALSDTGTILKDGKPFFPIGIYHPQNYAYYRNGGKSNGVETVGEDYDKIAAMGFNAVQGSSTENVETFGRYLDEAHQRGLVVDVPFYSGGRVKKNLRNSLQKIERYRDHPAVLNWKISDEPDLRPAVVDEVPEVYVAFKKADPRTPVEVTLATDHALDSWSGFADIIQINRYPLPDGALTRVSDYTRLAVQSKLPWQNVSYVIQSGWRKEGTVPTKDELRSMVYLALIEGAKGIWYYTMYDPGFDLTKTSIWPHLKSVNAEIRSLSLPVMLGKLEPDATLDNARVYSRALEYEGQLHVLLTNPERTAETATLMLPEKWARAAGRTLDGQPVKMTGRGRVTLEFGPVDSRTLIFGEPEQ